MDRTLWTEDEEHYATLALPRTTAEKYFDNYDDLTRARTLEDGRVTVELGQIWDGDPFNSNNPSAHQLLKYWGIDPTVLGEDSVEWVGWCDG